MKSIEGDIVSRAIGSRRFPLSLSLQVTDRCNYDCVHCYQEHTQKPELSFEEIEDILRQAADAGTLLLSLMGGEFFMRPDADDILGLGHELGFAMKLLTTGHHIGERRADFMATLRPIQVDMSFYAANAEVHEQVTLQRGSWQRTLDAARRLIARKIPVRLKSPAMEGNAADVDGIAELAREIGALYSFDPKLTGMENGDDNPLALRMSAEAMTAYYRAPAVNDAQTQWWNAIADKLPYRELSETPCGVGHRGVFVNPQGIVRPCVALPNRLGDLRRDKFADIWNHSEELESLRTLQWSKIEECNVCELRDFCNRCHGMAMLEDGKLAGPSLEACRHAVASRDALREQGLLPETATALPPTWDRVDPDGQHHKRAAQTTGIRSPKLKVLP